MSKGDLDFLNLLVELYALWWLRVENMGYRPKYKRGDIIKYEEELYYVRTVHRDGYELIKLAKDLVQEISCGEIDGESAKVGEYNPVKYKSKDLEGEL